MDVVTGHVGYILGGFLVTVELTLLGYVGALLLGTVLAVFRVGPITPLRIVGAAYVEFFRNIPLLTFLILFVFGLPDVGLTFSLFLSSAVCLAMTGAAYVCESVRSGINAVPVGQAEAARAIGLSFSKVLRLVVLPQAFRTMVPPLVNVFIGMALGSSIAAAVGVAELTNRTQQLNLEYAQAVVTFLVAGAFYVAMAFLGAGGGRWLERRLGARR
ncbi:MAG: Amino acid transporter rane protein [Frankiales bacterium]|nr:Amino acid transporter rane protein [Frankiales bacterium]